MATTSYPITPSQASADLGATVTAGGQRNATSLNNRLTKANPRAHRGSILTNVDVKAQGLYNTGVAQMQHYDIGIVGASPHSHHACPLECSSQHEKSGAQALHNLHDPLEDRIRIRPISHQCDLIGAPVDSHMEEITTGTRPWCLHTASLAQNIRQGCNHPITCRRPAPSPFQAHVHTHAMSNQLGPRKWANALDNRVVGIL